jgi:SAM-dependent MidA family methyltransferase
MTPGEDLLSLLKRRIHRKGRITFAEFMSAALYEPGLGRYCRPEFPMGPQGDYITSPEVDEAFGRLLGRAVAEMAGQVGGGEPGDPFTIVEVGPGRGTLCRDLLAGLAEESPDLHEGLRYVLVESSETLAREQKGLLTTDPASAGRVTWKSWPDLLSGRPVTGCILANEFLDALPVHLAEWSDGRLREVFVGVGDGDRLVEILGEPSTPDLEEYFRRLGITLVEGQRAEVNLEALQWVRQAATLLRRGYAVIVDYGHEAPDLYSERHFAGTLLAYRRHQVVVDLLATPGEQDLTSHVDFTSVVAAGQEGGFTRWALTSQRNLLISMGLPAMIAGLAGVEGAGEGFEGLERRFALHALMNPSGMGETFKVLVLGRECPVSGLRSMRNPFRDPVEGAQGGVYYSGNPSRRPADPAGKTSSNRSERES